MSQFIEMFGDISVNSKRLPTKKLGDVANLINGRAYKASELLSEGKYLVLRVGNFFSNSEYYYSDLELEPDKYCDNGDLLYSWSATFGAQVWNGGRAVFHYHIWKVQFDENVLNKEFFCYMLNIMTDALKKDTHGSTMVHLTKEGMEKKEIVVPPISQQKLFISIIHQADKSEFVGFKSQFIEEFGTMDSPKWETKTLPEISQNMDSKRIPIRSGNRKQGKYPYYGASGIVDYVDDYIFDEKILLVSEDGANLKERVAPIAFSSEGKVWVNNHAHVLRFNDYSLQKFVEYYLNYNKIDRYLTGTAQPKLNQDKLNNIPIPFPPEKQLRRFDCLTQQADKSEKCCEFRLAS